MREDRRGGESGVESVRYSATLRRTGRGGLEVEVALEQFRKGDLHGFCLAVDLGVDDEDAGFEGAGDVEARLEDSFDAAEGEFASEDAGVVARA